MSEDPKPPRVRRVQETPAEPIKLVAVNCNLIEPHELIRFLDGRPKEVARITKWMQAQIDAGLLKRA